MNEEHWTDEIIRAVQKYYYLSLEAEEEIRAAANRAADKRDKDELGEIP